MMPRSKSACCLAMIGARTRPMPLLAPDLFDRIVASAEQQRRSWYIFFFFQTRFAEAAMALAFRLIFSPRAPMNRRCFARSSNVGCLPRLHRQEKQWPQGEAALQPERSLTLWYPAQLTGIVGSALNRDVRGRSGTEMHTSGA